MILGYGLIRSEGGTEWITGGLFPRHRGQGHGRYLFQRLTELTRNPTLEVLATNHRAVRLYRSLGYEKTGWDWKGRHGPVITMTYPSSKSG